MAASITLTLYQVVVTDLASHRTVKFSLKWTRADAEAEIEQRVSYYEPRCITRKNSIVRVEYGMTCDVYRIDEIQLPVSDIKHIPSAVAELAVMALKGDSQAIDAIRDVITR